MMEGVLKYFFKGGDAYVLSRFSSKNRIMSDVLLEEAQLVEKIVYGSPGKEPKPLDPKIKIIKATKNHISDLVSIYRTTFETYPSPLTNPDYVKSSMDRDVIYRLAFYEDTAIAAASAEIDPKNANAEMTDCATIPEAQGQGIMQHLLVALEEDVKEMKLLSVYTLARAISYGMNCAFFRLGYEFSGRLINNCDIFGRFEDMNIWVKKL
jgi:putative beta-lysine N-acetyltransferase